MQPSCSVLPILDTELGVVNLRLDRLWHRFLCPDPSALNLALNRAVGPACWEAGSCTLTVRVPRTGNAGGSACAFILEPLDASSPSVPARSDGQGAILIG